MEQATETLEVEAPVRDVYNQWTQFEDFPRFMEGVEQVQQLDDTHLRWVADIAGKRKEWTAEIVEQEPDKAIQWRSESGAENGGAVVFEPLDADRTRVTLKLFYEPEGVIEKTGAAVGVFESRVKKDLENFRDFIQERGGATGAWRGEVHDGQKTSGNGMELGDGGGSLRGPANL